jgi:hypothetical protein
MMFQPDEKLRAQLKRRCKELAGHDFVDVRWHPTENCLAIFERHRAEPPNAPGTVRRFIVDDKNQPRQIHQGDVNEVVDAIYGRSKYVDDWRKRWIVRQEELKVKQAEARRALSIETAREMVRIYNYGPRKYAILGASDRATVPSAPNARLDSGEGRVITDLRGF